jgi:hypothetical protein
VAVGYPLGIELLHQSLTIMANALRVGDHLIERLR